MARNKATSYLRKGTELNNKNKLKNRRKLEARSRYKKKKDVIKRGTWNVRSIIGKKDEIIEEMKVQNPDYMGVTEAKKKLQEIEEMNDGYWLYWLGVDKKNGRAEGVGIMIKPEPEPSEQHTKRHICKTIKN
ncbi:hypothetical protein Trydic_g17274 [Trypoxylus dichotomus]